MGGTVPGSSSIFEIGRVDQKRYQIRQSIVWSHMGGKIEIRAGDSRGCHFICGLMLGYYDVEDTWPHFNHAL